MSTRDDAIWRRFKVEGRAEGFPAPCGVPYAEEVFDAMRANNVKATWLSPHLAEQSEWIPEPGNRRVAAPYPDNATTATAALEEVIHCAQHERIKDLPTWGREAVVKWKVQETFAKRYALVGEMEAIEAALSRRYATYLDEALRSGETTIEEVRRLIPDWLLGPYALPASNGHAEITDEMIQGWLAGPAV